jgi:uncharacterized protein
MTHRLSLIVLILAGLLLVGCSPAVDSAVVPTLSTSGTGIVNVTPDMVTVNLGVQTQDPSVSRAVSENNAAAQAVIDAAGLVGLAASDIQSTYFSVWSQPMYDEFGNPTEDVTYTVDHTLTVKLRDTSKLGDLLQAAIKAGANTVQGVTFGLQDPTPAQDQARDQAMQDGQARAQLLASSAGVTLGKLKSVSTSTYTPPMYGVYAEGLGGGGGGVPTAPGTQEVQVQVTLVYEIQ